MHLDDEQLQRLLHGELPRAVERSLRDHLVACDECRARLADLGREESETYGLLLLVDHPAPRVTAEAVAAAATPAGRSWGRWAAGVLLALTAAGAAYALPGSPLREWVREWSAWVERAPEPASPLTPELAGIAIEPGSSLTILFTTVQPEGQVRVSLAAGDAVRVRAPTGAARFTSNAGRLVIDNSGSPATFEVEIPRGAARVEIAVAGDRIFLKEGARVTAEGGGEAGYLLPLVPSP